MTRKILAFVLPSRSEIETTRLHCVWETTGNPAQPLACRWVAGSATKETSREPRKRQQVTVPSSPLQPQLCTA